MCHHCGEFEDHYHEETIRQLEDELSEYRAMFRTIEERINRAAIRVQVECETLMDDGTAHFIANHVSWIKHLEWDDFLKYAESRKCTCTKY